MLPKAGECVTSRQTDFFADGPAQPGPPIKLPPQEFVDVVRHESGYSIVKLQDGRSGWVDSTCIRTAPPLAKAAREDEVFPENAASIDTALDFPAPDLTLPVDEIPSASTAPANPQ